MTDDRTRARRNGWILIACGVVALAVAAMCWWSQWDVPPDEGRPRLLLGLPMIAFLFLFLVVGVVAVVKGRMPEEEGPRYSYLLRRWRGLDREPDGSPRSSTPTGRSPDLARDPE